MIHWKELASNSSFRNLFSESGDNPLRKKIDQLEIKIRDMNVTDPIQTMRFKAELAGIRCVEEIVLHTAEQISSTGPASDLLARTPAVPSPVSPPTAPREPSVSRPPRQEKTLLERMFGGRIGT